MDTKVRETLEEQLQLLSERSKGLHEKDYAGLVQLTQSMCAVANAIACLTPPR